MAEHPTGGDSMMDATKYAIGTSGYSFADWVGNYYPEGTKSSGMLASYVQHFETVELNFTYYRMPNQRTLGAIAAKTSGYLVARDHVPPPPIDVPIR